MELGHKIDTRLSLILSNHGQRSRVIACRSSVNRETLLLLLRMHCLQKWVSSLRRWTLSHMLLSLDVILHSCVTLLGLSFLHEIHRFFVISSQVRVLLVAHYDLVQALSKSIWLNSLVQSVYVRAWTNNCGVVFTRFFVMIDYLFTHVVDLVLTGLLLQRFTLLSFLL